MPQCQAGDANEQGADRAKQLTSKSVSKRAQEAQFNSEPQCAEISTPKQGSL